MRGNDGSTATGRRISKGFLSMFPREFFHHCPRCGSKRADLPADNSFRCAACGFLYYFNPAIAVAGFVSGPAGLVLFIRRAKEPARGKLALPGGFVDYDETAEEALGRETREEVNLELGDRLSVDSQRAAPAATRLAVRTPLAAERRWPIVLPSLPV